MHNVGIITFHCADDYGAMLQAYGLKEFLRKKGVEADIVRYEPPFMTGRYWWIPYIPIGGLKETICYGYKRWKGNLRIKEDFFRRRRKMKRFREEYLFDGKKGKQYFKIQMVGLRYRYYIVGSDQIWNPEITYKLREVYFGDFRSRGVKKVVAYAASLGGAELAAKYDVRFSALLQHVDAVSVREESAVSYVKQFYKGDVVSVLDPAFLLQDRDWKKIERIPKEEEYIFVYMTEQNQRLIDYVKKLAEKKKKLIIRVRGGRELCGENVVTNRVADPADFLGYIHKADYVVTNSFHATAFSIIYRKRFMVFGHSSTGERISNILLLCGLENRILCENENTDIDDNIDWKIVRKHLEENVKLSENFLLKHIV